MPVGDEQATALRALLTRNFEEHARLTRQFDDDGIRAYMTLVYAAFFDAVDRRFSHADLPGAVVEYIGDVRSRNSQAAEAIDPAIAEQVVLRVLGHGSISDIPGREARKVQNLLLPILIEDEHRDDAGIDAVLAAARKLAQA